MRDTAGQEKFAPIGSLYYRGANAVLLTYDITNKRTFDNVEKWKEKFAGRHSSEQDDVELLTVLVGCKSDLDHLRQVRGGGREGVWGEGHLETETE